MNILTNEDNPNTLKLIIAAKVVQQSVTVKKVEPKGISVSNNSFSNYMMKYHISISSILLL